MPQPYADELKLRPMLAACQHIKDTHNRNGLLGEIGISADNFKVFVQPHLWLAADRNIIEEVLRKLRDGMAAHLGHAPFQVPAEYVTALLYMFVNPSNMRTACTWFSNISIPATELAMGEMGASEPVNAQQLFAQYLLLAGNAPEFEHLFNTKVGKEQAKARNKNKA